MTHPQHELIRQFLRQLRAGRINQQWKNAAGNALAVVTFGALTVWALTQLLSLFAP
jgi:hypothetical protein